MHAVERLASRPASSGDRLVGGDHQLLDEHVRQRLALDPGPLDAALAVEGERDLAALDAKRPAGEPAIAEGTRTRQRSASVSSSTARSSPARTACA